MKIVYEQKLWDIDVAEKPEYELSLVVDGTRKKHMLLVKINSKSANTEKYFILPDADLTKLKKTLDVTPTIIEFIKYAPVAVNDYDASGITSLCLYDEVIRAYELLDTLYSVHKACCSKDLGENEILTRLTICGKNDSPELISMGSETNDILAGMNSDRTIFVDSSNCSIVFNDGSKISVVLDAINEYLETLKGDE